MLFTYLPESDHPAVALRPLVASDIADWFSYLSMPQVYEHTSWAVTSAAELATLAWSDAAPTPSSALRLAIADRFSGRLVGTIGFHTVSAVNKTAELAYDLTPGAWNKGIATQLGRVLVAWAHAHVGLVRVQATALETNARSARVLHRCGFVHEGLLRNYRMVRGTPGNFNMYSHTVPTAS